MKKLSNIILTVITFALCVAFIVVGRNAEKITTTTTTEYKTPLATQRMATATKHPTATVDFQKTAQAATTQLVIAQSTSIEAARINAQATANHEDYLQAQIEATQSADNLKELQIHTTATAAVVSIPLTSTAQVVNSTAIANYQAMQAAQMTATKQAPDLLREMKSAQAYNAIADFWVHVWALGMFGVFAVTVPMAMFRLPRKSEPAPIPPAPVYPREPLNIPIVPTETVVRLERTGSFPRMDKMVIPCTREQFDEFVRGVILERRTLAYNNWEGADAPFTRDEFTLMRNFLQANQLAQSAGNGSLIISAKGEEIFNGWIEAETIPTEYNFYKAADV